MVLKVFINKNKMATFSCPECKKIRQMDVANHIIENAHHPDVVVIGEIRDIFSAQTSIQTALTGHKVLTTFHTEDCIGALVRLLNMHIEPFLVSSTVVCVLAQRLLRRVCTDCAAPYQPDLTELRRLGTSHAEMADAGFSKAKNANIPAIGENRHL